MRKSFLLVLIGLLVIATQAQQTAYTPIDVEVYQLKNGLTVILNEDHNLPQVFGSVIVRAGGKDDPKGATGMAHYQEHMLFKGTQELGTTNWEAEKPHIDSIFRLYDKLGSTTDPEIRKNIQKEINAESLKANEYAIPGEMFNLLRTMGGTSVNAGTINDYTIFFNAFPSTQVEKWLDLYSHRFENPVFRGFQAELEVVYEEKNMYSDNFASSILENFNRNFFRNHPYGQQTLIGTIEDLKNPSLTKMYDFFTTWYVPNNMALILTGDFDKAVVKPLIETKFGKWERKETPQRIEYMEEPFKGREQVTMKLSPVKIGILGFRTVPAGHPDEIPLSVCNAILSNQSETGLFDKLILDNKLMAAQVASMPYNDEGATIILFIPKILGQKLSSAEDLLMDELQKLKSGEFESVLIDNIKTELFRNYQISMESNAYRGTTLAQAFARNQSIDDLLQYPNQLMAVTKEDVVNIAKKYYGDNYLAFYSKMGFPKKQKIDKPDYTPLAANLNAASPYAQKFEAIPETRLQQKFVDFDKDVEKIMPTNGMNVYCVKNPANDVFQLTVDYKVGHHTLPQLKYATDAMNLAYPQGSNLDEFKAAIAASGCTYSISGNESYTSIEVVGFDDRFNEALVLIGSLLEKPALEQEKMGLLYEGAKTERKMEHSEPDNVAGALLDFVKYGQKSEYIDRPGLKEIKSFQASDMTAAFQSIQDYGVNIHYSGNLKPEEVASTCQAVFKTSGSKAVETPVVMDLNQYAENTVYFVDKKKATQSNIYFFANGSPYNPDQQAVMDAFNVYFGGDFSGLVLQEIREARSMAYSAGAKYVDPELKGKEKYFMGKIGTQADKTVQAITIFDSLVRFMPAKPERTRMIQQYLSNSSLSKRPHFRNLSADVVGWQNRGFETDPAFTKQKAYENLKYDDIQQFYASNIADKPMVICIVGDKKRIATKELEQFGKVVFVKEKELFGK
ncbi:MAG: insulinase family protein [Lentimicrobium sp.]|jgi:predicted Zn-dependent peptidase|nr:insulinase family protein [Lentimicrobium sp.]